jgi:ATP-binding cassette subfamily B (MDR/TAP) protein 1
MHAAAKAAGIHDLILSLPHGYATNVGDGGFTLSGGQTQRICIARALVRRPSVLILDEATSALDSSSAKGIRDTIMALKSDGSKRARDLTVIVITHSVEMMRGCERVIMMEKGCVVEEGEWSELMSGRAEKGRKLREMVRGGVWEGSSV